MNGPLCSSGGRHVAAQGTVREYQGRTDETAECFTCGHPIRRFYIDDEDDRRGGWSAWTAPRYVIEELELTP